MSRSEKYLTIEAVAELVGGKILQKGASDLLIKGIGSIYEAKEGEITFVAELNLAKTVLKQSGSLKASALIVPEGLDEVPFIPSVEVKNPHLALAALLNHFHKETLPSAHIDPSASVSDKATVSPDAVVGPLCVIEEGAVIEEGVWLKAQVYIGKNARVGKDSVLYPGVRLLDACAVGERCILHANAVIGSDGFGFVKDGEKQIKVLQVGNVLLGNDVEVGACTTIDRATMNTTHIKDGVKLDNLVHIAHNCIIGENSMIMALAALAGSTIFEEGVIFAGQSGTSGHITLGKGSVIVGRSGVTKNVPPGSFMSGFPLRPHAEERRIKASLTYLPDLVKRVAALEKKQKE